MPKRVQRKTGSTQDQGQAAQDQAQQDVSRRPPLSTHVFLDPSRVGPNRDLRRNVGIPEEVQPATSHTTWVYLRNSSLRPRTPARSQIAGIEVTVRVKKKRRPVQLWGWCPPVLGVGRPPVLGLVTRRGVPAPLLLFLGVCSPHGRLHSRAFLPRQQAPCLTGDTSSHEVPGVLRLWCSSRVALLWRRTPSTARFNGALHSWN